MAKSLAGMYIGDVYFDYRCGYCTDGVLQRN